MIDAKIMAHGTGVVINISGSANEVLREFYAVLHAILLTDDQEFTLEALNIIDTVMDEIGHDIIKKKKGDNTND